MSDQEKVEVHVKGDTERKFTVSKIILTSCSNYFNSMFSDRFVEGLQNKCEIKNTEPEIFDLIIQYLEKGSMKIVDDVVSAVCVFQCAHVYQFRGIKEICEPHIYPNINIKNCFDIYKVASQLQVWKMAAPTLTCATWNCEAIFKLDSFLDSSLLDVCKFMRRKELNICKEFIIWEAICGWIKKDEKERKQELLELLTCIDYTKLKISEIEDMIPNEYVVKDVKAEKLLNLVKRVLENRDSVSIDVAVDLCLYDCDDDDDKLVLKSTLCDPEPVERTYSGVPWLTVFETIDDECTKKRSSIPHILGYDCKSNSVRKIFSPDFTNEDNFCVGFRVCSVGYRLYFLGGQFQSTRNSWNDVRSFNTVTEKWDEKVEKLPQYRRNHMICVVDSVIYLIGGYGEQKAILNSMDAFDTKTGKWLEGLPVVPFNGIGGCCAYNKTILIFAGDKMHVYYVEHQIWNSMNILSSESRTYVSAVCHKHFVYLLRSFSNEVCKANVRGCDEVSTATSRMQINIEYFCSFYNSTENVCVTDDCLFSFTVEDHLKNKPIKDTVNIIEVIPLTEESLKKYKTLANSAQQNLNEEIELDEVRASPNSSVEGENEPEYRRIERSKVNVEASHSQHSRQDLKQDYLRRKRNCQRTGCSDDDGEESDLPAQHQQTPIAGTSSGTSSDDEQTLMQSTSPQGQQLEKLPLQVDQIPPQARASGASYDMKDKSRTDKPLFRTPFVPEQGIKIWERKVTDSELPNITFITGSFYYGCSTLFKLDEDCVKKEVKGLVLTAKKSMII